MNLLVTNTKCPVKHSLICKQNRISWFNDLSRYKLTARGAAIDKGAYFRYVIT